METQTPRMIRIFSDQWGVGIDWDITRYAFELEPNYSGRRPIFKQPSICQR